MHGSKLHKILYLVSYIIYIIAITFVMTLSMHNFTNVVIPTYFQFIQMPIIETKFDILCILTIVQLNTIKNDWN